MHAVLIKIKADLASRRSITALILLTIIASSTLLTLALATILNITGPYDRTFQELNAAHIWLYFNRESVDAGDVARVASLPGVVEQSEVQHYVVARARIGGERAWVTVRDIRVPPPGVNRVMVEEGRYLEAQGTEVLAGSSLKETYGLEAGQVIEITGEDGATIPIPVAGLAYDATWDWYASEQPPPVFVSHDTLRALFPDDARWGWALGVRLRNPDAVEEMIAQIDQVVGQEGLTSYVDWRDIREASLFGARINVVFLGAFSFFAIVATLLVVASSTSSIVLSQFRQIGILKAIGFTQAQVIALYAGQSLILSLIGAPVGLLTGVVMAPLPLSGVATAMNAHYRPPLGIALIVLVVGTVTGTVLLATAGAAVRAARANIIRSIAVGAEAPRKRTPRLARALDRFAPHAVVSLGLADLSSKPVRSLLTGVNLILGVLGIVFGLAVNDTVNRYRDEPALLGIAHDAVVTRAALSDGQARQNLQCAPGVAAFYGERQVAVTTPGGEAFKIRAVDGDLAAFPIRIEEGRLLQPGTDEAIAGRGLLDLLGLSVGDQVTATRQDGDGTAVTWRIVGRYPEPANVGEMLTVNLATVREPLSLEDPETYLVKLAPGADGAAVAQALGAAEDSDLAVTLVDDVITDDVAYLQWAIFGLSAVLIGIALVNVFNSSLLVVQERVRVIGIYKTVGMTPAQVVALVGITAALLGLQALVFGIPLGLLLTRNLLEVLSANYGFGTVELTVNPLHLVTLIPAIVLVSVAGSWMPGRWAARASIVRVLRRE